MAALRLEVYELVSCSSSFLVACIVDSNIKSTKQGINEMNTPTTLPMSSVSKLSSPVYYFALALGWSWSFWILAILLGVSFETPMGVVLGLIGLLGPMVAGIGSTYLTHGKEGRRDYWLRVIDVRRIGA